MVSILDTRQVSAVPFKGETAQSASTCTEYRLQTGVITLYKLSNIRKCSKGFTTRQKGHMLFSLQHAVRLLTKL